MLFKCRVLNRKRFLSALCILLTFSFMINPFAKNVYAVTIFPDLKLTDYYYNAICDMYQLGVVMGYEDGEFKPRNNVTYAEVFTMLFYLVGLNIESNENSENWYSEVMNKAIEMELVPPDVKPNSYATRVDVARFVVALYELDISKTVLKNIFLDTNSIYVNTLYQNQVIAGVIMEDGLKYLPNNFITRGDFCVILRKANEFLKSPYPPLIKVGKYRIEQNPSSMNSMLKIMETLGESGKLSITIPYTEGLNSYSFYSDIKEKIIDAYLIYFSIRPEYFSFTPNFTIQREINEDGSGNLVLKLSNADINDSTINIMRTNFSSICELIVQSLYNMGELTYDMTEKEKVRVLYEYVILHTQYDLGYDVLSFTGYGAAVEGKAVCQGYVAFFNELCRYAGIKAEGVAGKIIGSNEAHIWSKVYADEEWIYCDVTFGDPVPDEPGVCNFGYFDISYENLMVDRVIDERLISYYENK